MYITTFYFRCATKLIDNSPDCADEVKQLISTNNYCGALVNTTGPFKSCLADPEVDSELSYTQCELDLCAVYDDFTVMKNISCGYLTTFAKVCKLNDNIILQWRDALDCRMFLNPQ